MSKKLRCFYCTFFSSRDYNFGIEEEHFCVDFVGETRWNIVAAIMLVLHNSTMLAHENTLSRVYNFTKIIRPSKLAFPSRPQT